MHVGQPFDTQQYDKAKQHIFVVAHQQGYLFAQLVQHSIIIDRQHYTASIKLTLETGARYYFGGLHFSNNPLSARFLQRYATFKPGQPYSPEAIFALQNALTASQYFQGVIVEPQINATHNYTVPINIQLTPRKAHTYTLGGGYGTDTGVRGTVGWEWRPVNSLGHVITANFNLSQKLNIVQAAYTIPGEHPNTDHYTFSTGLLQNILPLGKSLTEQLGVASIKQYGNWQRTYSLNYQFEQFKFNQQLAQSANLLVPGLSWLYLKSDDPLYTRYGNRFNVRLQGSSAALLSTTSFLQGEVQDKYIYSFNEKSRILLRGALGYTTVHDLQSFPLSLRFYAGGTQSLRGYQYQSIGPGRYLQLGSVEYQHQIFGKFSGAIFYDEGSASNHFWGDKSKGVGLGIVWQSPVGPLELTIGQAISKRGHPLQIQFSMGPDLA